MGDDFVKGVTVAVLPNAGLANKLFVWAKAQTFAHVNGIPVHTIGWSYPKIGPILRGEKSSRLYSRFFERTSTAAALALISGAAHGGIVEEPVIELRPSSVSRNVFTFRRIPGWQDMFGDIREQRTFLRHRAYAAIRPVYAESLERLVPPIIAIHVRRGDFRQLNPNENFRDVGGVRTPDRYFTDIIHQMRSAAGVDLPITVFSDGSDKELSSLLSLPNVSRSKAQNDVEDLLLMSRSRVIVLSAGSTYSEWAGFLSDAVLLRHPDHINGHIRPATIRQNLYEGPPPSSPGEWNHFWKASLAQHVSNLEGSGRQ